MPRKELGLILTFFLMSMDLAWGDPLLSVNRLGPSTSGTFQWQVAVTPDPLLFSETAQGLGGSVSVEIGFTIEGGSLISVDKNESGWPYENPGHNPFTGSITEGIVVDSENQRAFVAVGSEIFTSADAVELVTIATQGTGVTTLHWGGQVLLEGTAFQFTGGRVAQGKNNYDGIAGQIAVLLGDFDDDLDVDSSDLTSLLLAWTGSDNPNPDAAFPNGDLDGDLDVDSADLTTFLLNWTGARQASPLSAAVPEPAGASLVAMAAGAAIVAMRRSRGRIRRSRSKSA